MLSKRTGLRLGLAVAALLACLAGLARAADDDKALRRHVLELNQVTGDDPIQGAINTLKEDKAGTPKLLAVAVKMAAEKEQPLNYNGAYILARTAEEIKDLDATVALYRVCIDRAKKVMSPTKLFLSYGGIIAVYENAKKYDESVKVCKEFLDIPEEKPSSDEDFEAAKYNATLRRGKDFIRRDMVAALIKQGKTDEANKEVEKALKERPSDMEALELHALVLRERGDYAAAAKIYEDLVQRVNKTIDAVKKDNEATKEEKDAEVKQLNVFVRKFRYYLSGSYIDSGNVAKAVDQLKTLLKEEPDNPSYNNDLGYVWADHDMNLTEAEKLIRKAIEDDKKNQAKESPELKPGEIKANPAYLDSLGWVLYKQKKYKEALPALEDAVKGEEGKSIEIYDHLAEVHLALGDKAAAVKAWKKGVEIAGTSKREQQRKTEVEKKIKANQ